MSCLLGISMRVWHCACQCRPSGATCYDTSHTAFSCLAMPCHAMPCLPYQFTSLQYLVHSQRHLIIFDATYIFLTSSFFLFLVNLLSVCLSLNFNSFTLCFRFSPPTSEVLKFAWIQYIAFFVVISFLLTRLSSFLFRHQVMEFMTCYIILNQMFTMLCHAIIWYDILCYDMPLYAAVCHGALHLQIPIPYYQSAQKLSIGICTSYNIIHTVPRHVSHFLFLTIVCISACECVLLKTDISLLQIQFWYTTS